MKQIQYDFTFMLSEYVGEHGISAQVIDEYTDKLKTLRSANFVSPASSFGFMQIPFDQSTLDTVKNLAKDVQSEFSTLLVLGIGGSDLGARATLAALPSSAMRVLFLGSNTDPCEISQTLEHIDWSTTAVNVISKSGDTIETMATYLYVRDQLIRAVGTERAPHQIIATTDAHKGTLKTIADREGYRTLVVPDSVGGRFSVLSSVGLFPIACAGVDIDLLCAGARDISTSLLHSSQELHATEMFALLHYIGFTQLGQNVHVLIPYSSALRECGFWFRQLWAESLGKKEQINGTVVFTGPTPVAALGATDQHSQFQLYYYGPFDKLITFIDIEEYGCDIRVPDGFADIPGVSYMKDLDFGRILRTELQASALALAERNRPNGRLVLPQISAYFIGQLFQFLEISTVYFGLLLEINPFDQPGVELGKQNMYALFNRDGFEKRRSELDNLVSIYAKKVL